jgi:hypothetical protein
MKRGATGPEIAQRFFTCIVYWWLIKRRTTRDLNGALRSLNPHNEKVLEDTRFTIHDRAQDS